MPQLDFSWWLFHLLLKWSLLAAVFLSLSAWANVSHFSSGKKDLT